MKFKIYREFGALNSKVVFDAVESGIRSTNHQIVDSDEDVSVIWSVLWKGRMKSNRAIYENAKKRGKQILIIEVGNLLRGNTWRVSLDNINRLGDFGLTKTIDLERPKKLNVSLKDFKKERRSEILICTQEHLSLQWTNMPPIQTWIEQQISQIRKYSDRKVIVRLHPRNLIQHKSKNYQIEIPKKIIGSYDSYDIDYNYHCVINFNSGPAVQAGIEGIPVICDQSSLAYPISNNIENVENLKFIDRTSWFLDICHTEWTVDEIKSGIPFSRIFC